MISEKFRFNAYSMRIEHCIFRNSWHRKQKFFSLQRFFLTGTIISVYSFYTKVWLL